MAAAEATTAPSAATSATPLAALLADLDADKTLITNCADLLTALSDHYAALDRALADRAAALESKIHALESSKLDSLAAIDRREAALPDRESSAAAKIAEIQTSAVAEMVDPDWNPPEDLRGVLQLYCRRMDSAALWRFLLSRRKDLSALRKEVPAAVAGSVDPVRLVLDAVDDFLNEQPEEGAAASGGERFWALGMLVRALFDREGKKPPEVSEKSKERAAAVAEALKAKLDEKREGGEGGGVGGPEAQLFLQLVVAFGLSDKFEQEFLKGLVLEHAGRKEMGKLVGGLGFGEKLADIIDELIKTGKVIEAVYFAHESGLTEQFSPVPLIKSYLQSSKKNASDILKNGNHSVAATEESSTLELSAARSIIYCVESLKIEREFPLDGLRKRLSYLERAKADRKSASKSQNKRTRAAATGSGVRPAKAMRTSSTPYSFQRNSPSATHQFPPAHRSYDYSKKTGFDRPAAAFGAAHSRSPAAIPPQYYGTEGMSGLRTAMPYGSLAGYSGYDYATPHSDPFQPAYPHQH